MSKIDYADSILKLRAKLNLSIAYFLRINMVICVPAGNSNKSLGIEEI